MPIAFFEPVPESLIEVRRFILDTLSDGIDPAVVARLAVVLATNAIAVSRLTYEISIDTEGPCLRVRVNDLSAILPGPANESASRDTLERRLGAIRSVTVRWGSESTLGGRETWFEICK